MPDISSQAPVLVWFRRDLRLADHAPLSAALRSGRPVHCAFVFDTGILDRLTDRRDARVSFIWHSLAALKAALRAAGGDLLVRHGEARRVIPELAAELGVAEVYAGRDYAPAAKRRDAAVAAALAEAGRALRLIKDHVIFEADEVRTAKGEVFRVFTPYKRAWLARLDAAAVAAHGGDLSALARPAAPSPMPELAVMGFEPVDLAALGVEPGEAGA